MRYYVVWMLAATAATCYAAPVQELVRQAIAHGKADGNVEGPLADAARTGLHATGKLSLTVLRVTAFPQPGCARLRLHFTQQDALMPGAAMPGPYSWITLMNICADGNAPQLPERRKQ